MNNVIAVVSFVIAAYCWRQHRIIAGERKSVPLILNELDKGEMTNKDLQRALAREKIKIGPIHFYTIMNTMKEKGIVSCREVHAEVNESPSVFQVYSLKDKP